MPNYQFEILTPITDYVKEPLETTLVMNQGTITKVEIDFPYGSAGLLHVSLWKNGTQMLPANRDGYYRGNEDRFETDGPYSLAHEPFELVAKTWNHDTLYPHVVFVNIEVDNVIENKIVRSLFSEIRKLGGLNQ